MVGLIKELNRMLGIEIRLSTAFHPQTDRQTEYTNQELEQYLCMFIDHRQEQWPEWLGTVEFTYNNKVSSSTQVSLFRENSGRDPRMGFEMRKKRKYKGAEEFMKRMKEVQKEAQAALKKAQREMKKYADKRRSEGEEYKVGDQALLSTKDLKWQMEGMQIEKLVNRYIRLYKVKRVIALNAVELELLGSMRIYLIVNVSRTQRYKEQVGG